LSTIPAGSIINSATLNLVPAGCLGTCATHTVDIVPAQADVAAATSGVSLVAAEDTGLYSSTASTASSFDVSALVAEWFDGTYANNGLVIQAHDEQTAVTGLVYYSTDASVAAANRPTLVVNYTPPSAPSAPSAVTVVGGDDGAFLSWEDPPTLGVNHVSD